MSLALDTPRQVGRLRVAALAERQAGAVPLGGAVLATGRKHPVALVVADGAGLWAVDLRGWRLAPAALEAACPGLHAAMGVIPP
jgi:hypothetical protein